MNPNFTLKVVKIGLAGILITAAGIADAVDITGAGASFPAPVYAKWAEAYHKATGNRLNYQAIGSGGGIKQIKKRTVDFGATDAPMTGKDLDKRGLLQFPAVIGGIVPVLNVAGIKPGELKLSGPLLADIFSGAVTTWNDPALAKLNPELTLPAKPITVVYRSDSSGTTSGFTTYLADVQPGFEDKVGAGKTVNWPTGIGGKGNAGVAANVLKLKNSIGYVEYAFAKQNKMSHAAMINKAGKAVQPDDSTFAAAAAGADWSQAPGFGISLNNQGADTAWPITSASFILMYKVAENPDQSAEVLKFFKWALNDAQQLALDLDYVPLPPPTVKLIETAWGEIKNETGKPVMAMVN
ncbi:MAG: phosphate ABC transporter substrate-binding protein PstS [Burkholderiaceae bacterium]